MKYSESILITTCNFHSFTIFQLLMHCVMSVLGLSFKCKPLLSKCVLTAASQNSKLFKSYQIQPAAAQPWIQVLLCFFWKIVCRFCLYVISQYNTYLHDISGIVLMHIVVDKNRWFFFTKPDFSLLCDNGFFKKKIENISC